MDTQLLPYRLKSARRKKRLVKKYRDKRLLQIDKRRHELGIAKRNLPMVPLEMPYQKGWERLFVLKPAVRRSDKAAFYQGILNKINTAEYHYDESFNQKKRGKRWHRYNSPRKLQTLRSVSWYEWTENKLKLTDEEKSCFEAVTYWNNYHRIWSVQYRFAMPWLFELAVRPYIIDKVKLSDPLIEQEMDYIDNKIERSDLKARLRKLNDGKWYSRRNKSIEKLKYLNPLKNIPVYLAEDFA
ncbi:MAG TPA: hypothetical protein VHC47_07720 [Mucilaginibacter sp.]|nr:hypothetical protein [Mucilaginibacter sp.]